MYTSADSWTLILLSSVHQARSANSVLKRYTDILSCHGSRYPNPLDHQVHVLRAVHAHILAYEMAETVGIHWRNDIYRLLYGFHNCSICSCDATARGDMDGIHSLEPWAGDKQADHSHNFHRSRCRRFAFGATIRCCVQAATPYYSENWFDAYLWYRLGVC